MEILNWILFLYVSFFVVLYFLQFLDLIIKTSKRQRVTKQLSLNRPKEIFLKNYQYWKTYVEPRYSNMNKYPPDWDIRKKYIEEIYEHKCALCGIKTDTGHVHHIHPLSKGGNNSINNLAYLCRSCHEDQHDHMEYQKKIRKSECERRGITEEEYIKEKKDDFKMRREAEIKKFHENHSNEEIIIHNESQKFLSENYRLRPTYYPLKKNITENTSKYANNRKRLSINDDQLDALLNGEVDIKEFLNKE